MVVAWGDTAKKNQSIDSLLSWGCLFELSPPLGLLLYGYLVRDWDKSSAVKMNSSYCYYQNFLSGKNSAVQSTNTITLPRLANRLIKSFG